jgi:glucose/mannose transport system permease protein
VEDLMATTMPAEGAVVSETIEQLKARGRMRRRITLIPSVIGTLPMAVTAIAIYVICIILTVIWSFTNSKLFPNFNFVPDGSFRR